MNKMELFDIKEKHSVYCNPKDPCNVMCSYCDVKYPCDALVLITDLEILENIADAMSEDINKLQIEVDVLNSIIDKFVS